MDGLERFKHLQPVKTSGGVNSPFNDAVDRAIKTLGLRGAFPMWCGILRGLQPHRIDAMVKDTQRLAKDPTPYLIASVKRYKEEMKKIIEQ